MSYFQRQTRAFNKPLRQNLLHPSMCFQALLTGLIVTYFHHFYPLTTLLTYGIGSKCMRKQALLLQLFLQSASSASQYEQLITALTIACVGMELCQVVLRIVYLMHKKFLKGFSMLST